MTAWPEVVSRAFWRKEGVEGRGYRVVTHVKTTFHQHYHRVGQTYRNWVVDIKIFLAFFGKAILRPSPSGRQSFPSRRDRTRGAIGLLILLSSYLFHHQDKYVLIIATTDSSAEALTAYILEQNAIISDIRQCRHDFRPRRKFRLLGIFAVVLKRLTSLIWQQIFDKTTVLVPNLRSVAVGKMACEYAYWPLTKVGILRYNFCWQSNSSGSTGIKLSFDDNARKVVSYSNYTSTFTFEFWSPSRNVDNPLRATIKRLSAQNYDKM